MELSSVQGDMMPNFLSNHFKFVDVVEGQMASNVEDIFKPLSKRHINEGLCIKVEGLSDGISDFLKKVFESASKNGAVFEDTFTVGQDQIDYFRAHLGTDFKLYLPFIFDQIRRWLPRMPNMRREQLAMSLYNFLCSISKEGPNVPISRLQGLYTYIMCYFYFKLERVLNIIITDEAPKVLYKSNASGGNDITALGLLSSVGIDVVIVHDKSLSSKEKISYSEVLSGSKSIPKDLSFKALQTQIAQTSTLRELSSSINLSPCTNAWIDTQRGLNILLEKNRGNDSRFFYNAFYALNGVDDVNTYTNDLFSMSQQLKSSGRKHVIVNVAIPVPTPDEVNKVVRSAYSNATQLINHIVSNVKWTYGIEVQSMLKKAFIDVMTEYSSKNEPMNKLVGKAVYLICWINRYLQKLLPLKNSIEVGAFIYFGSVDTEAEVLFLKLLSRLPIDVLVINPSNSSKSVLEDKNLYQETYQNVAELYSFPTSNAQLRMGTVAYHAERDLDTMLYQDTGIYREKQFTKANIICLQTMYEEIKLLWDEEVRFRPNFSSNNGIVNVPVVFSKVCGVKDGDINEYWSSISKLITEDTIIYTKPQNLACERHCDYTFYKNGTLQRKRITEDSKYPYGLLRDEIQSFMLDKLEDLISKKLIKGIGSNGMEYKVIDTFLNLPTDIIRKIQSFDFTKKNPKLIYVLTGEDVLSVEETILITYLNLIGFDIMIFIPTGYQCIGKYMENNILEEHNIGGFEYGLTVPDLKSSSFDGNVGLSFFGKLFKRGK